MSVLVGIDEAGFGPILGPLVVSSSALSLPRQLLKSDLWQVLSKSVAIRRRGLAGRLLVADSKKVYSRAVGIGDLERTVLAFLRCLGAEPATLGELLMLLCPSCLPRLADYPWHEGADGYSLSACTADGRIASSVLADDLSANGMSVLELKSCCFDVAYYNKLISDVKNKASVLFTAAAELIQRAFDSFGGDDLQVIVDRQGGRVRYRKVLRRMFPELELTILGESAASSSYQLCGNGKRMRLHFVVAADERFLPVSLASMVCKYLRELLMDSMNRYFARFSADLRPTAGYWTDGLRFIKEVKTKLPHLRLDDNQFIRSR